MFFKTLPLALASLLITPLVASIAPQSAEAQVIYKQSRKSEKRTHKKSDGQRTHRHKKRTVRKRTTRRVHRHHRHHRHHHARPVVRERVYVHYGHHYHPRPRRTYVVREHHHHHTDVIVRAPQTVFVPPELDCPIRTEEQRNGLEQWCATPRGTRHGPYVRWFEDGTTAVEGAYAYGERDGVWNEWHPNGAAKLEAEYDEGTRVGTWFRWDRDGSVISIVEQNG